MKQLIVGAVLAVGFFLINYFMFHEISYLLPAIPIGVGILFAVFFPKKPIQKHQ